MLSRARILEITSRELRPRRHQRSQPIVAPLSAEAPVEEWFAVAPALVPMQRGVAAPQAHSKHLEQQTVAAQSARSKRSTLQAVSARSARS